MSKELDEKYEKIYNDLREKIKDCKHQFKVSLSEVGQYIKQFGCMSDDELIFLKDPDTARAAIVVLTYTHCNNEKCPGDPTMCPVKTMYDLYIKQQKEKQKEKSR